MEAVKNDRVAKATDWIPEIGPDTFFAYGCSGGVGCGIHPLRASQWYRMSNATTANGCFFNGFWVCAHFAELRPLVHLNDDINRHGELGDGLLR